MQPVVDLLKELYAYNRHMNRKLVQFFHQHSFSDEKAFRLFSHILNAHHTWLARIEQQKSQWDVWQIHHFSNFERIDEANHQKTNAVLATTTDFNQITAYHTSGGSAYENRLSDILIHVVNHSTYHRGQIASIIREKGYDPPVTDYIFYQREKR